MPRRTWSKVLPPEAAEREAAGLRWLAAAQGSGGAAVVTVVALEGPRLVLERLTRAHPQPLHAREFGRALARTHAAGALTWGMAPPGTRGDGVIGAARLATPTHPEAPDAPRHWGEFYATYRLLPHLRNAVGRDSVSPQGARAVEEVCALLVDGAMNHPQPQLLEPDTPARVHGDLWSGNVMWTETGCVLIDPAAHGGHAETDLAMLALFGLPYLQDVLAGYQEVSPLAPGWQDRVHLHQLHPLLVHAELFGGWYGDQAVAAARACT
ncbi:fructosamine kinase family protein [Serinibacter salmoneus]|uniref:Fructosamine-3-kinase n=1 Tax=Serinibacter salmoneus TaxID=556530 RepID=A0A2A9D3T7_9MICO|nr:fructosamine kinase family protein [Serinibacter salmoneus]PFG18468.1 fructosamine-3-kinase [Serinibacter salmoneus]PFG21324.1 fructosamine-3-kinase [Serinibacter salmoneus]